jgi:hypothetical protein
MLIGARPPPLPHPARSFASLYLRLDPGMLLSCFLTFFGPDLGVLGPGNCAVVVWCRELPGWGAQAAASRGRIRRLFYSSAQMVVSVGRIGSICVCNPRWGIFNGWGGFACGNYMCWTWLDLTDLNLASFMRKWVILRSACQRTCPTLGCRTLLLLMRHWNPCGKRCRTWFDA